MKLLDCVCFNPCALLQVGAKRDRANVACLTHNHQNDYYKDDFIGKSFRKLEYYFPA